MNVLKQARGHLKGAITRAHTYITEVEDNDIDSLETRLARLEEIWQAFCGNQNELFQYSTEEGYGDPEIDFETTETKYVDAKSAFMKKIRENRNPSPPPPPPRVHDNLENSNRLLKQQAALLETLVNNSSTSSSSKISAEVELPQFKISPFGGDYREWPEFRDMFLGSIDCKQKLPGAQKMRYLKSFLRDDAAKLLAGIEISDSNYEQAWEKLESRYNKPLYIINAYIESFLKMPTVVAPNSVHLRRLADKSDEVIRGLKALKSEERDPWLIYILLSKTDIESRKAWALHINNSEKVMVQDLIDFLVERCDALEACETNSGESKNRGNRYLTRSSSASNNIKSFAVLNNLCFMCKENHPLPQCPQFLALPVTSRRSYARDHRLCYNCLGSNHSSSRCRSKTRCPHCRIRHHKLVHLDPPPPAHESNHTNAAAPEEPSLSIITHHAHNVIRQSGILPTVLVKVIDIFGRVQICRVLLDTGSQASFVTEGLVKRLGLRRRHARLPISGISSLEAGITQGAVKLNLKSRFDANEMDVDAFILNQITSKTPLSPFDFDNQQLRGLNLADPGFCTPGPIDILLGSDKVWSILCDGRRRDDCGNLIAQNTIFGWVITGNIPERKLVALHMGFEEDVDILLRSFWEIEELPHKMSLEEPDDTVEAHFCRTFSRAPDNKYIVELPFRQIKVNFGNSLSGALSRLFAMERRFARNENLRVEYCHFMNTYQELGHMELIAESEIEPTSGKVFYLPHHAVVTQKLRVVFDGSHKDANGISLNEMLHIGPPLQRNLIKVCIRFRMHKYVFCADIVKMFRQIWVDPKHRDFQRIVWRNSPDEPIRHYRLRTVTYGLSSAPFLSMRVLKQLAFDYKNQFPMASHAILNDFYVDDIMTGADSVSEILVLKEELTELLSCGGLQLSKWSSNCWPIIQGLNCEPSYSLDLDSISNCTKVLGLVWNPHRDALTYNISLNKQSSLLPTKRMLLSEISKVFDPLGFLAPALILFKMLFQELWVQETKIGWDDPLPTKLADKWISYRKDLIYFERIAIERRCTLNFKNFDLIGFSDASEKAYSAVVYARSCTENGEIKIQLLAAKTRVAPVKQLTIPRLELCGALLLSRLMKMIRSSLDIKPAQTFVFCDSQIVLAWLSANPSRWTTFIANRTSEILDALPRSNRNYVRSAENPADCASRGIEPSNILQLKLWWDGPSWLLQDSNSWPIDSVKIAYEEVPEQKRKPIEANLVSAKREDCTEEEDVLDILARKVSSWFRMVRIVAFVFRFASNSRTSFSERQKGFLRSSELLIAKRICLTWAQKEFTPEIEALNSKQCVSSKSKLSSLSPFLDDVGLLRVGGRLSNAVHIPFSEKHPIILPKNHPVTQFVLKESHIKYLHAGVSELFSLVRHEFWIIGSRNLIRKIVHDCMQCFRQRQITSSQLMGNLPSSRLSPSFAFERTGVDYAGPITLRMAKGRKPRLVKGFFAVFICMVTRALHLEVVSDLTTDAFLAALRRFIARRGRCNVIYSDNGTNFQGAAKVLSGWYKLLRSKQHNEQIVTTLATEGIKWEFIPPYSPHFGGLWEAGVKSVKQHLRRVLGNIILTFEEMYTLLAQIEALLNSRPLCAISDSDLNPLTPSHFLIGRPYTAIPEPSYLDVPSNRLGRWELLQNMAQGFWHRWHSEYLTSLQQRPKWKTESRNLQVGDLVVVKELNTPPSKWALGRVEELYPGKDNLVRVVSIRTQNGIFKRPITKLAVLPSS